MTREFLEGLGLEKDAIDKILDENSRDIGKEKSKTTQAKADLADARSQLEQRNADLEELKKSSGDASAVQKQLEELQEKYNTETETYKKQIADRDRDDAIMAAIAAENDGKGLVFTSKSGKNAFLAMAREKLTYADGKLEGFAKLLEEQRKEDPDLFGSTNPPPRFAARVGTGGAPAVEKSKAAQLAEKYHAERYGTVKE